MRARDENTSTVATMPIQASRTLFDIIKDEESGTAYRDLIDAQNNNKKKNPKSLKDRLRLRRSDSSRFSSSSVDSAPSCEISLDNFRNFSISTPMEIAEEAVVTRHDYGGNKSRTLVSASTAEEQEEEEKEEEDENEEEEEEEEEEIKGVSLMALLAETDRQQGMVGSTLFGREGDEEEEEEDEEEEGDEHVCCVCMVEHRGSAIRPCGHTFCRLCSKELCVSGGKCPLCKNYILEILHIF